MTSLWRHLWPNYNTLDFKILTQCVKLLGERVLQVWWWYPHRFRRYRKKTRGGGGGLEIAPPPSGARVKVCVGGTFPGVQGNPYPKIKLPGFGPLFFWGEAQLHVQKQTKIWMNDIDNPKLGGGGAELPKLPSWGTSFPECPPPPPASLAKTFRDMYWVTGFCGGRAVARAPNTMKLKLFYQVCKRLQLKLSWMF